MHASDLQDLLAEFGVQLAGPDEYERLAARFESPLKPAIERIQNIREQAVHSQLAWYIDRFTEHSSDGLTVAELTDLFEADDWRGWEVADSEDIEAWENWEGEVSAFNQVLDILQILAHGGTPEQGA
jgi:hypothetical protein